MNNLFEAVDKLSSFTLDEGIASKDDYEISNVFLGNNMIDDLYKLDVVEKSSGNHIAYIEYSINDKGEYHIKNTRTFDNYKRKGIAALMCKELQSIAGDDYIYMDTIVPEAMDFWKSIADLEVYKTGAWDVPYYRGKIKV